MLNRGDRSCEASPNRPCTVGFTGEKGRSIDNSLGLLLPFVRTSDSRKRCGTTGSANELPIITAINQLQTPCTTFSALTSCFKDCFRNSYGYSLCLYFLCGPLVDFSAM